MKIHYYLICIIFFLITACKTPGVLLPSPGTYSGRYNGQEVVAQVVVKNKSNLIVTVSPHDAPKDGDQTHVHEGPIEPLRQLTSPLVFNLKLHLSKEIDLHSNSRLFPHFKFKPISGSCFASVKSRSTPQAALEFCWGGDTLHVFGKISQAQSLELSLNLTLANEMPPLETPASYKISDLIARAKTHNFETIVEFQKVLEAKAQAQTAYMALLPHFNINDGLGLISLNYLFILRSIGDYVPFLLPSRWYRAAEMNDLHLAEKQAWIIMDADGMNITENLAISARRDSGALTRLQAQITIIEGIRDLVRIKENAGILQVGSSDDLTSLIKAIETSIVQLQAVQTKELSALSHAAGFYNPRAILSIDPEDMDPNGPQSSVQNPIQLDLNNSMQIALVRSAELRQVLAMVEWAKASRDERIYNWLDPIADPSTSGLGATFPSYLEVSYRQIDEMMAKKEQMKVLLFQKVSDTFTELNMSLQDYNLAVQSKEIQARRVLRLSQNLKLGINFVMNELTAALQDQVKADIDQVNAEHAYLISVSRLNRLLYQGTYAEGSLEDKKDF